MALLLAKNEDFASWRGVEEFTVAYRDAAVKLASHRHPEGIAQMLGLLEDLITGVERENDHLHGELQQLVEGFTYAAEQGQLRNRLISLFDSAYLHFSRFGSSSAFFAVSERFLCALAECCLQLARQQIGEPLPPVAILVMGPAGRREATRYCRMQMALIWEGDASEELMKQLGSELVDWFRACGIALEETVTPLNPDWRGSLAQWQARFEAASCKNDQTELIDLLRLADRMTLVSEDGIAGRFGELCVQHLGQREFIRNLVERCQMLSNGISMMGSLRIEKSGPHRGAFPLLDHALLPLAATVSSLCLMYGVDRVGTPERLRELVRVGKLGVDLAERALHAWYCFSEHRLCLEQRALPGQDCRDILQLTPTTLGSAESDRFRSSLETVGDLQRYMQISFGMIT